MTAARRRAPSENPGAGDEADDRADPVPHLDVPDDVHKSLLVYCRCNTLRQRVQGFGAGGAKSGRVSAASAPSSSSNFSLVARPPGAEKPPIQPRTPVTRWQGITIGHGLRPSAWPTRRESRTSP